MIERFSLWCEPLSREVGISVYIPVGLQEKERRYPVVYFFDGQMLFSGQGNLPSLQLEEFLDQWPRKFIVVGIDCDPRGENRLHEYTPYALEETVFGPAAGLGEKLLEWVVNTLKPAVDVRFPTWWHREATAIAGVSMGALMAFFAITRRNDVFSKAACLSPSLFVCPQEISREFEQAELNPDTRIYWSFGNREMSTLNRLKVQNQLNEYVRVLQDKGGLGKARFVSGKHNENTWRKQNPDYFTFLFEEPGDL